MSYYIRNDGFIMKIKIRSYIRLLTMTILKPLHLLATSRLVPPLEAHGSFSATCCGVERSYRCPSPTEAE